MKKCCVVTCILALVFVTSLASCAPVTTVRELEDEVARLSSELAQVKATKEISFGNGLRVFDIEKGWYEVQGKIQNVSSEPMQKVVVLVAFYDKDGQLDEDWGSVATCDILNLFPGEVMDWKVEFGNWTDEELGLFDIYAIGKRGR